MRISKKLRADIIKIYAEISLDYGRAELCEKQCNLHNHELWLSRAGAKWDVLQILLDEDDRLKTINLTHSIVGGII